MNNVQAKNQQAANQKIARPISKEFMLAKKQTFGRKLLNSLIAASVVITGIHTAQTQHWTLLVSPPAEVVQIFHPIANPDQGAPAAPAAPPAPVAQADPASPTLSPFVIAGYHEIKSDSTYANREVLADRDLYMHNKAGLNTALSGCVYHIHCPPSMMAFSNMLNSVKQMQNPYAQVETINGWVNLYVTYDMHEAKVSKTDADHRSLHETVLDAAGVCDEQAQLKLFALEKIGFPSDSVRYVGVNVYDIHSGQFKAAHAVTMVQIDNTIWVLNNQQVQPNHTHSLDSTQADILSSMDSLIEDAPSAINFTNASKVMSDVMVPDTSFNSSYVSTYDNVSDQNVMITDEAKNVGSSNYITPDDGHLSSDATQQIFQAERTAISFHYQIQNGHYSYG